jgi:hypothetical protein
MKKNSMKTIFYYNITNDEIRILNVMLTDRCIENRIDYENSTDEDLRNSDLYRLFLIRGKMQMAEKYLVKIKNTTSKYL